MHLDDWQIGSGEGIEHRHRGVRQRSSVEDYPFCGFARFLDPVDELPFVIGLPEIDLEVERGGTRQTPLLDIGQCVATVNRGIANPEQVEIGAVQDKDGRQIYTPLRRLRYTTHPGSGTGLFSRRVPPCESQRSDARDPAREVREARSKVTP